MDAGIQLPNRIREWRKKRGLVLDELAAAANVTRGHMGNLERGRRELTKPILDRIAARLGLCVADLLTVEDGGLSEEERRLIHIFRLAPEGGRLAIAAVAESQAAYLPAGELIPLHPAEGEPAPAERKQA